MVYLNLKEDVIIDTNFSCWKVITSSRNIISGKLASNRLVFVPLTVKFAFWNIILNIWGSSILEFCALFKGRKISKAIYLVLNHIFHDLNKFLIFNFRMECDLRGHFFIIPVGRFHLCSGIFELQKGTKKPNWNQRQNSPIKKKIHKIRTKRK